MTTETTFDQIVEKFDGDRQLVEKIADSIGIQESYCKDQEDYHRKVAYSFNSESGANCPVTDCWLSSSLVWQAALAVHKH